MFYFKNKSKTLLLMTNILLSFALLFALSCEKRKHTNPFDPSFEGGNPTMKTVTRTGILKLIPGSTLQVNDIEVVSFSKSINLAPNGNFSILSNEANKYQTLFFNHKITGLPVYF
ncbi:MAG TPA: hypothetical protein VGD14_14990, partial [bacterium]